MQMPSFSSLFVGYKLAWVLMDIGFYFVHYFIRMRIIRHRENAYLGSQKSDILMSLLADTNTVMKILYFDPQSRNHYGNVYPIFL